MDKQKKEMIVKKFENSLYKIKKNKPRAWNQLSYAGETRVPAGISPLGGSWPLFIIMRDENGNFIDPITKELITFDICHPNNFNFEEQLDIVRNTLINLTPEQKEIALYWGQGPATKQWAPIIDRLIDTYGQLSYPQENPIEAARILAAVQAGINDAFIITWYFKYIWEIARPNQFDQSLATFLCTPKFPSYPSGHSVISGCAQEILTYFFPPEADRLRQLAEQDSISRVYAGVHFPVDAEQGLRLGQQIGRIIVSVLSRQRDAEQTRIDPLIIKDLHANLPPPPYIQAIPFPRPRICDSLITHTGNKKEEFFSSLLDD